MIEFLVISWVFVTPLAIWRLSWRRWPAKALRFGAIPVIVAWTALVCWVPIFLSGLRDVPSGARWRSLFSSPIGAMIAVPLAFALLKLAFSRWKN